MKTTLTIILLVVFYSFVKSEEKPALIREYNKVFKTYPFSDPDPIPIKSKIYPYFKYDGYADQSVDQEWKVIELENDYIKVMILPEIGGKIWTAIEKSTGRPFIYYNHTVKFRNVAMRGPWTSGGIEANYGIIGHSPHCATPVDYLTRTNSDGSVSCFIGVLDLLTRTNWRLEINLQKDKAFFTTSSFWHNSTALEQPYYHWMNVGLKAAGNLEFIYPGTHHIGHGGEASEWPVNPKNGKKISFYDQNNFGSYKSYHVFGKYTDFFGAFWHDENFGMVRYSTHDDKPGKKIWIWGLSQQGMIWEDLLTDTDGQYVEVQSGRLFNQAGGQSTQTPFKHRGFTPNDSESWTEYWYPVLGTDGMLKANQYGSLNLNIKNGKLIVNFSPTQSINDTLRIYSNSRLIYTKHVSLNPLELFIDTLSTNTIDRPAVQLGDNTFYYDSAANADVLTRPIKKPDNFDWNSVYGKYVRGKEFLHQKNFAEAEKALKECLQKNPHYVPALADMAMLLIRRMDYEQAVAQSRTALSVDTYHGAANYYYGLANYFLGNFTDAKDGFDLASAAVEFRSAAFAQLAKIYMIEKNYRRALHYCDKCIDYNHANMNARQIRAVIYRRQNETQKLQDELSKILVLDPLNHFARFEKYMSQKSTENKSKFLSRIRNELPDQTFLELAVWYDELHQYADNVKLLRAAQPTPEILYWLAWSQFKSGDSGYKEGIKMANSASPSLAYPFRPESIKVLNWAIMQKQSWRPNFYQALIHWNLNNRDQAAQYFQACGDIPDEAPFYAARSTFHADSNPSLSHADLKKAIKLDPHQWRYGKMLAEKLMRENKNVEALTLSHQYFEQNSDSYIFGMLYAKALLLNKRYRDSVQILESINILPYEGATDGRRLWHEAHLFLTLENMKSENFSQALHHAQSAKLWPKNLGVGKPYLSDIDERLEDWLEYVCLRKMSRDKEAQNMLSKILSHKIRRNGINDLISAWAWDMSGDREKGESILTMWIDNDKNSNEAKSCLKIFSKEQKIFTKEQIHDISSKVLQRYLDML